MIIENTKQFTLHQKVHRLNYVQQIQQKQDLDLLKQKIQDPIEFDENLEISQNELIVNKQEENLNEKKNRLKQNKNNLFKIQNFLKKVVKTLLSKTIFRRIALLNKNKILLINDNSVPIEDFNIYDFEKNIQVPRKIEFNQKFMRVNDSNLMDELYISLKSIKKLFYKQILAVLYWFPTIQPHSNFTVFWNIINSLLKLFLVFLYSFQQFFHLRIYDCFQKQQYTILYTVILLLQILDMFINMNKVTINQGVYIQDKQVIAQNYFKKWFIHDVLSIIPIIITLNHIQSNCSLQQTYIEFNYQFFLNFFIFLMINNFYDSVQQLEKQLKLTFQRKLIIKLGRLIFFLFFLSHLVGCTLKFANDFGKQYLSMENTWMGQINNEKWTIQYIYSYYWATTTMITVGYGDLSPKNPFEIILITIIQFLGCGVFGFMINQIGSLVSDIKKRTNEFQNEQELLNNYLQSKGFPNELIQRASANLEYIHKFNSRIKQCEEQEILKKLSTIMQQEIASKLNRQIIEQIPIINKQFSKQTIEKIRFQEHLSTPNETIITSRNLFFLQEGIVDVYITSQENPHNLNEIKMQKVYSLQAPQIFGESGFFIGEENQKTIYKSVGYCSLYSLNKNDFLNILKQNICDFERFKEIQDDLIFNKNYNRINLSCLACLSITDHWIYDCPSIHLTINKKQQIVKLMNQYSSRTNYKRQHQGRFSKSIIDMKKINMIVKVIREQLQLSYFYSDLDIDNTQFESQQSFGKAAKTISHNYNSIKEQDRQNDISLEPDLYSKDEISISRASKYELMDHNEQQLMRKISSDNLLQKPSIIMKSKQNSNQTITHFSLSYEIDSAKDYQNYFIRANLSSIIKIYQKRQRKSKMRMMTQKISGFKQSQYATSQYSNNQQFSMKQSQIYLKKLKSSFQNKNNKFEK